MLTIKVDVNNEEQIFEFEKEIIEGQILWTGSSKTNPASISLSARIGDTPNFSTISTTANVSTPHEVIYERFIEALSTFSEKERAGLEENEGNEKAPISIKPYDPDSIKVRRETFSAYQLNRMMTVEKDVDLNPDFQRNLVWDNTRKSLLIESILLGIPIPVFYFAESKSGIYHVVDGLQRLSTIKQFFNNEFPLKNLEHIADCEGRYYSEDPKNSKTINNTIDRKYARRLENAQLNINVIESASPQKVKFDIFKRLNTGGRPLNHQEVRNCVAEPLIRNFLKSLAGSEEFKSATGESVNDYRMDAQELVLRFIGFKMEREGKIEYVGDMNSFLDDVLDIINDFDRDKLKTYEESFYKSMRICYHLFGRFCFRKCLSEHLAPGGRKQLINKALFVTWSMEVLPINEDHVYKNIPQESFAAVIAKVLDTKGAYYSQLTTSTSDKQKLKDASEQARKFLKEHNL